MIMKELQLNCDQSRRNHREGLEGNFPTPFYFLRNAFTQRGFEAENKKNAQQKDLLSFAIVCCFLLPFCYHFSVQRF